MDADDHEDDEREDRDRRDDDPEDGDLLQDDGDDRPLARDDVERLLAGVPESDDVAPLVDALRDAEAVPARRQVFRGPRRSHRARDERLAVVHPQELREDGKVDVTVGLAVYGLLENRDRHGAVLGGSLSWRVREVRPRDADRDAPVEGEGCENDEEEARGGAEQRASHGEILPPSVPLPARTGKTRVP